MQDAGTSWSSRGVLRDRQLSAHAPLRSPLVQRDVMCEKKTMKLMADELYRDDGTQIRAIVRAAQCAPAVAQQGLGGLAAPAVPCPPPPRSPASQSFSLRVSVSLSIAVRPPTRPHARTLPLPRPA